MKRAVICVTRPWEVIGTYEKDYSIMVVNPSINPDRLRYLLDNSDYSVLVSDHGVETRNGSEYPGEKVYWFTSGTTGDSKFFSFSAEQLNIMSETICRAYDITPNDRYFNVMPLWHGHGQGFYWATQRAGCDVRFGAIKDKSQIELFQPTFVTSIPDMMPVIMRLDLRNLRFVRTASSSMPQQMFGELKQRFQVPVIEAFGMTEALSHCFTNPLHGEQRMGTVGLPDGIQARIESGRLMIQGPNVFQSGWYDTGDLAEYDSCGYYKILGRSRDQINIKGKKFNPVSLETQLLKHVPGLTECVIFGSDKLKCLWMGESNPDFIRHCLSNMDHQLKPTLLEKVESIPKLCDKISRSWLDKNY